MKPMRTASVLSFSGNIAAVLWSQTKRTFTADKFVDVLTYTATVTLF